MYNDSVVSSHMITEENEIPPFISPLLAVTASNVAILPIAGVVSRTDYSRIQLTIDQMR